MQEEDERTLPPPPAHAADKAEPFWDSPRFWQGLAIGLAVVFLIKTVIAIQWPYGIDWYGG